MRINNIAMKRRDFLKSSLPVSGAVLLVPGYFNVQAMGEINQQFSEESDFDEYDLVTI